MSHPTSVMERAVVVSDDFTQVNFLVRRCEQCGGEVVLGAGDVLFGDRWYHCHCWEKTASSTR